MILRRTSISTGAQPVTLEEMREHLRINSTAEDEYIKILIMAAREQAENKLNRALVPQTWRLVLDGFPEHDTAAITLLNPPLSTVTTDVTITFTKDDTLYSSTTLPATMYTVDHESEPGCIYPSSDNEWPSCVGDIPKAVTIDYRCGYPVGTVPRSIQSWIKLQVGAMYENRESLSVGRDNAVAEFPRSFVDGLLDPYVVVIDI